MATSWFFFFFFHLCYASDRGNPDLWGNALYIVPFFFRENSPQSGDDHIKQFDKAILLVREPYGALKVGRLSGFLLEEHFSGPLFLLLLATLRILSKPSS